MKIRVDFFRAEIMATLKTIREYSITMEKQLDLLHETREALLRAEAKSWEDLQVDLPEFKIVFDHIFPRCLRYSFVVFLYSVVETELEALGNELRKRRELPEDPISGKATPLERCKTFLSKNFTIDFGSISSWEKLVTLEKVRNCIAHAGGRIEDSRDKEFLGRKAESGIGLNISDHAVSKGRLSIEQEFCVSSSEAAISFFDLVFERTGFGPEEMKFEK